MVMAVSDMYSTLGVNLCAGSLGNALHFGAENKYHNKGDDQRQDEDNAHHAANFTLQFMLNA